MAKQTFTTGQVLTAAQMTSLQQTAMGGGAATAKTASYVLVAADAGTTVAMNAAGATTITVNTGLFAAGDTVFIQNLGAGACTITAGTATVDTSASLALAQHEGGTLYFTSAGVSTFFKAAGTAASSYNPNYTIINSGGTSLSGASTQISSISNKTDLFIFITGFSNSSTAGSFVLTLNNDTSSLYNWYGLKYTSNGLPFRATGTSQSNQQVLIDQQDATRTYNAAIKITGCNSSGLKIIEVSAAQTNAADDANAFITMGYYSGSSAITSIEFKSTSSNFDAGTIYVYGA